MYTLDGRAAFCGRFNIDSLAPWHCFPATFTKKGTWTNPEHYLNNRPPGSTYALCLHEFTLGE